MSMTTREMSSFFKGKWIARLVTLKKNGYPHITPVWYDWDGRKLVIVTKTNRVKYRNIKTDSRVALCIDTNDRPYKGVIVEGKAEITDRNLRGEMKKMISKYVESDEERQRYLQRWLNEPRILLVVHPTKTITWDNSKTG
ncbi:MAG: PPOX class F420-dependent oxidoreductase [Thaumarchaeota archaeon]|nr:PPOX class F420-dependent oxidoreductase [Nitrososphaerota archaeon]